MAPCWSGPAKHVPTDDSFSHFATHWGQEEEKTSLSRNLEAERQHAGSLEASLDLERCQQATLQATLEEHQKVWAQREWQLEQQCQALQEDCRAQLDKEKVRGWAGEGAPSSPFRAASLPPSIANTVTKTTFISKICQTTPHVQAWVTTTLRLSLWGSKTCIPRLQTDNYLVKSIVVSCLQEEWK